MANHFKIIDSWGDKRYKVDWIVKGEGKWGKITKTTKKYLMDMK